MLCNISFTRFIISKKELIVKKKSSSKEEEKQETKEKEFNEEKNQSNTKEILPADEVESLADRLGSVISVEKPAQNSASENKQESKTDTNYFEKKVVDRKTKLDDVQYKQVKERIKAKLLSETRKTQLLPVDECVKSIKEHEKRVQVGTSSLHFRFILIMLDPDFCFNKGISNEIGHRKSSKNSICFI